MPYSYDYFKPEIKKHLIYNLRRNTHILDVGAGAGTYGKLLRDYFENIDAIEIYTQYIYDFDLVNVYKTVFNADILTFDYSSYNYIIFGDVIEHMTHFEAFLLLQDIKDKGIKCLVAIPYLMEQGPVGGNEYEVHLQSDLTHIVFMQRYHMMKCLYKNEYYGYYINYELE